MPRLVIKMGQGVGRDHALGGGACSVGRDPGADFTLDDTLASRRHFNVVQEGGVYWVEDLGSTNGTIVNGRKTDRAQLIDGDVILAGGTELTFVQKDLLGSGAATKAPARRPPVVAPPSAPVRPVPAEPAPGKTVADKPQGTKEDGAVPRSPSSAPVRRRRRRR